MGHGHHREDEVFRLPPWLSTSLIVLIAAVWAGTFTAGIFIRNYEPPESVNLVFSAVITTLILGRAGGGGGSAGKREGEESDRP